MSSHHKAPKAPKAPKTPASPVWSDWVESPEVGYYRFRYNSKGEIIYDYPRPENVPRTSTTADDATQQLTEQVGSIDLGQGDTGSEYTLAPGDDAAAGSGSGGGGARDRKGKHREVAEQQGHLAEEQPFYDMGAAEASGVGQAEAATEQGDQGYAQEVGYGADSHGQYLAAEGAPVPEDGSQVESGYGAVYGATGTTETGQFDQDDDDDDLFRAMAESRNAAYPGVAYPGATAGQSSANPGGLDPYAEEQVYADTSEAYEQEQEEVDVISPLSAPMGRAGGPFITGTIGAFENVDPRFKVMTSDDFRPGYVFKILWADPTGQSAKGQTKDTEFTERQKIRNEFGEHFYVNFRRFIIVGTGLGQSACVPVFTYGKKGCNKPGIKPDNHGIIYQYGLQAQALPGEPHLGYEPVSLFLTERGESLTRESRVNYSMIYTVQHNVKVFFIGYIAEHDFATVQNAVNDCFRKMDREYGGGAKSHGKKVRRRR